MAHYESTAEELYAALDGGVDMCVVGAGTGGSITGISRNLKSKKPECRIVGVDPVGSVLSGKDENAGHHFQVEGIGYDFVPTVLDMSLIDQWVSRILVFLFIICYFIYRRTWLIRTRLKWRGD